MSFLMVASITGSCIHSVAATQHLAPEMLQQNSQGPQQQGFTFCSQNTGIQCYFTSPTCPPDASLDGSRYLMGWQPLVAFLRMPEIAPVLGGSCVISHATFWQEQWASVKEATDPEGDIYLIICGRQLQMLGLQYRVCSGARDHPTKALCPTPTKENS